MTLVLCLVSCSLTLFQIIGHLTTYRLPDQQRYIIRIMLMVPIYAVDSILGIVEHEHAAGIALVRDTYEAYVLYNFFQLLMSFVGGDQGIVDLWNKFNGPRATMPHMAPFSWIWGPFRLNKSTVTLWRWLLVQYMVFSPLCTLIIFVGKRDGLYEPESWSFSDLHLYLTIAQNVSVTMAFTALFYFYLASKKLIPMKPHHPTGKFIAVKLVVFLSFWQGIVVGLLGSHGVFPTGIRRFLFTWHPRKQSVGATEEAIENLLTVAEMFITAVLHHFVFSHHEYTTKAIVAKTKAKLSIEDVDKKVDVPEKMNPIRAFLHAFSVGDVLAETVKSSTDLVRDRSSSSEKSTRRKVAENSASAGGVRKRH